MNGKIEVKEIDITRISADCIVNAANERLEPDDSVSGAIFRAAGQEMMKKACKKYGHCDAGKAVITEAFNLNAVYVIHAVGPTYIDGKHGEPQLLYSCYREALKLARKNSVHSIAFPVVASGILGYPREEAWRIGLAAIRDDENENPDYRLDVFFSVIDGEMAAMGAKILSEKPMSLDEIISRSNEEESETGKSKGTKKKNKDVKVRKGKDKKGSGAEAEGEKEEKPVFFWHAEDTYGEFSSRFEVSFVVEGIVYGSVTQYMMAKKALLFKDLYRYAQIMNERNPEECKALGREVSGFIQSTWDKARIEILFDANYAKFSQNPELEEVLLGTGSREIVEASPYNSEYGIGMSEKEAREADPSQWRGKNLLGESLMQVRSALEAMYEE